MHFEIKMETVTCMLEECHEMLDTIIHGINLKVPKG